MKADLAIAHGQFGSAFAIHHTGLYVHHRKHVFNVGHGTLHFPVNKAEKIQRHEHLHHEGIDQHEITQSHYLVGNLHRSHYHRGCDSGSNNQRLTGIESKQ